MRWELLRGDPVPWLLEEDNPSVRYFTLVDIIGKTEDDPEALATKEMIATSDPVVSVMSRYHPDGYWDRAGTGYARKYVGTVWSLILLAELGVDRDSRIERAVAQYFANAQAPEGGFFPAKRHRWPTPCLTGNMVRVFIRFGYQADARIDRAVDWLVRAQRHDGGWHHFPVGSAEWSDPRTHSCFMGSIKPLWAFAEIPPARRSPGVVRATERGLEFFLRHRLYRADNHGMAVIRGSWVKFGFPLWWHYDVLHGLRVVCSLGGAADERILDPLRLMLSKQDSQGRWKLEARPGRGQPVPYQFEELGKASKWITLNALRVLRNFPAGV